MLLTALHVRVNFGDWSHWSDCRLLAAGRLLCWLGLTAHASASADPTPHALAVRLSVRRCPRGQAWWLQWAVVGPTSCQLGHWQQAQWLGQ